MAEPKAHVPVDDPNSAFLAGRQKGDRTGLSTGEPDETISSAIVDEKLRSAARKGILL
jgi:hypothetical protein